jgi:formylglycine-generating enzyme required for sulfatase activity
LPVTHLSTYEVDAYARWAGACLPTEAEWKHVATSGNGDLEQLFDHCWQWTSSSYAPYPGYAVAPGAVGEYNGKFMVNQDVLRGSSIATPVGHARANYRNFFPVQARWQFTCAWQGILRPAARRHLHASAMASRRMRRGTGD